MSPLPRCIESDCKKFAYFNYPNENEKEYCENHKKIGMSDFRKRRCRFLDDDNIQCKIQATYGLKNTNSSLYCKTHKKENMIDITHKMCIDCNKIRPTFNYPDEK